MRESEQQSAVQFNDPVLGMLTLNHELGWFDGAILIEGRLCGVCVPSIDELPDKDALQTAQTIKPKLVDTIAKFSAFAADALLEIRNSEWIDAGEPKVSRDEFRDRLEIEAVVCERHNEISVWFEDGGLFSGHGICVEGNVETGPEQADLHG